MLKCYCAQVVVGYKIRYVKVVVGYKISYQIQEHKT